MAASNEIHQQMSTLLGRDARRMRRTTEDPPRISVFDIIMAITGLCATNARHYYQRVMATHPDICTNCTNFRFPGRGQRDTPITGVRGAVEIVMVLPGHRAAQVRRAAAALLVRYLGGDMAIVGEVCAMHGFQEQLDTEMPNDARRMPGRAVEASNNAAPSMLVRACTQALAIVIPNVIDEVTSRVGNRVEHLAAQQRINLNVRAPKRQIVPNPPITINIAGLGRPLPIAKFLDQKEIVDPSWRGVRRSLAPFFGMQMQILKKTKLQNEGAEAIYVEQNHRPQLFYTEHDRELMQEAWDMLAAHREDLVNRSAAITIAVRTTAIPTETVLAMLQRAV